MMKEAVRDPVAFQQNAKLRDDVEIAEMEQKLYHAQWQVRDAQLFKKPMPAGLHGSIVHERRYALSWLVGDGDDWDEVPTDT